MAEILIWVPTVYCRMCQHWTGAREVVEFGKRLRYKVWL